MGAFAKRVERNGYFFIRRMAKNADIKECHCAGINAYLVCNSASGKGI